MKITKEDLQELLEFVDNAEEFRPVVRIFLNILKSYAGEFKEITEAIRHYIIENRIKTIEQYEKAGFKTDDAILMTLDGIMALKKTTAYSKNIKF